MKLLFIIIFCFFLFGCNVEKTYKQNLMLDTKQQIQKIEKKFDLGFISEIQKEEKIEEIVVNSIIDSYFITGEVDYSLLRKYRKNIDFFTQFTSTSKSQYRIKKLNLNKIPYIK